MKPAKSSLLGVSKTSSDMRDLHNQEKTDLRAVEAVALFCYQAKKWIGSFAAALGGLDTLIFAGGIGENAPSVRRRVRDRLDFLGIKLDKARNKRNVAIISTNASAVKACIIHSGLLGMDESDPARNKRFAKPGLPQTADARRVI